MFDSFADLDDLREQAQEWLRRSYAQLLTSGAQLLLLVLPLQLRTRNAWLLCLGLLALVSVLAWLSALYRLRTLRDTPRSTIAAAAQGHVELAGRGVPFGEPALLSPLKARPCLWCRHRIEELRDREWHTVDSGETSRSFVLRDRSGECVVQPETAEIITRHQERWTQGRLRYTEWLLTGQDELRVVGQLRTQGGGTEGFDTRLALSDLLGEWKRDMPRLLARYDTDRNGSLNPDEWERVRRDAMAEVLKMRAELALQGETHIVSRPTDGRLFLISNMGQKVLERRYLGWAWAHLAIFFVALYGLGWVLQGGAA